MRSVVPKHLQKEEFLIMNQITQLHILEKFPEWKVNYNDIDKSAHLFHFSGNDGYAEVEVIINSDKTWIVMLDGKAQMQCQFRMG